MKWNKISFALLCAVSTDVFAQDVVVFGDSLSDVGQQGWHKKASYLKADHTLNLLYTEHVAKHFGQTLTASSYGGTNYAYSGGVILGEHNPKAKDQANLALAKQVQDYLATPVKKEALHILWAGGNDLAMVLSAATTKSDEDKHAYVMDQVQQMAHTMAQQWGALKQAGVDTLIAPTIPNVTYTPEFFEKLGDAAGAQINSKSAGILAKQDFVDAFKNAADALTDMPTSKLEDLEAIRVNIFEKAAKDFYDSRWLLTRLLLSGAGYDAKGIADTLIAAYQGILPQASLATTLLNASITTALNQVGGNIVRIDADAFLKDMIARPNAYGLTNTTGVVCKAVIATTMDKDCTPTTAQEADQKLFADSFHPGPVAHKAMADYVINVLTAPKEMAVLGQLIQSQSDLALEVARNESHAHRLAPQQAQTVAAIVNQQKHKQGNNLYVGAKVQFTPQWQFITLVGQQNQRAQQGGTTFSNKGKVLSTSLRYDAEKWWLGTTLQMNNSALNTQRINRIGASSHPQSAEATAQSLSMAFFTGYEWQWHHMGIALTGEVNRSQTTIDPFSVREAGLMQMQFAERKTKSLKTGTGLALRYQGESWQPYVQTTFVKAWNPSVATVHTTFNGSTFKTALAAEDSAWWNVQAGVQWTPLNSAFHATLRVAQDLGRKNHPVNTRLQAGVGVTF